ncbi:hypothetical protein AHMF7616_04809 [Adhaeribacter pallidiroseus]|uniref:Uncharacterized protein n=1 Tax=Adhaeribacter pallidiroseus TaxID=2072847 RepID=A0A369QVH3_9BACT|nr:hypothetical protein AHMF7616_04809 [Adhaeribacter pallidiroseus]
MKSFSQVEVRGISKIELAGIQSDSINLSANKEFEKRIKLKSIEKSENEVEIRFYELLSLSNTRNLKVLVLKNDIWKATEFSEINNPRLKISKFALDAPNGFELVIQKLFQNKLTKLPSQEALKPRMKKYGQTDPKRGRAEKVLIVNDGKSYTIEFKIGDKFRIYNFSNPETYANFYNDVQELKDYVAIKNIFTEELKRK